jgi:hypothetical protein
MAKILFRIVEQELGYGVEVTEPRTAPYIVGGFKTEEEAEAWVADRQFAAKIGDRWERLPDPDRQYW